MECLDLVRRRGHSLAQLRIREVAQQPHGADHATSRNAVEVAFFRYPEPSRLSGVDEEIARTTCHDPLRRGPVPPMPVHPMP
ncbi:hypothetical protein GCM10019016_105100 [Streptomyces prasinosporus]|uniref:Uncharacterized protein n=1 Tax=Streptomyces prasinosporus TaxID=68256 RepID=A0ABP6U8A3_9ACTN